MQIVNMSIVFERTPQTTLILIQSRLLGREAGNYLQRDPVQDGSHELARFLRLVESSQPLP